MKQLDLLGRVIAAGICAEIEMALDDSSFLVHGLRATSPVKVGQRLAPSWGWEEGDQTDERLDGTSAIRVSEGRVPRALESIVPYLRGFSVGDDAVLALIGSNHQSEIDGNDPDEVVLIRPTVLAVWRV